MRNEISIPISLIPLFILKILLGSCIPVRHPVPPLRFQQSRFNQPRQGIFAFKTDSTSIPLHSIGLYESGVCLCLWLCSSSRGIDMNFTESLLTGNVFGKTADVSSFLGMQQQRFPITLERDCFTSRRLIQPFLLESVLHYASLRRDKYRYLH